jgi:protein-tyrosine kinase
MGKIFDALEKSKKEQAIKTEPIQNYRTDPVEQTRNLKPVMAEVKTNNISNKLVVITAPSSFEAESFKLLRAQILFSKGRERPRTIMVTSAMPGDGKSFVAANLAASIAMGIDEYVLLVDCDLRRSTIHKMFGLSSRIGLHEYLKNEKELPELLVKTSVNKLSVLPAGNVAHNPTELLASSDMKAFLEEVGKRYDDRFIILDTPPSQILAESNIISNFVDGIIFVLRENVTPGDAVRKAVSSFSKEKILGIVVNGHNQLKKKHAYYYKHYYQ